MKGGPNKMKKAFYSLLTALVLTLSLTAVSVGASNTEADNGVDASLCNESSVDIVKDGKSDYVIVFAADTISCDNDLATLLCNLIYEKTDVMLTVNPNVQTSEYEILLGETQRELSIELKAKIDGRVKNNSLVWGIAYRDGKLAYTASSPEAFVRGQGDLLALVTEKGFTVSEDIYVITGISREAYEEELRLEEERLEAEKEAQKAAEIERFKKLNASFDSALFGESTANFANYDYGRADHYPTKGQHPRVNLDGSMLKRVKETMQTEEMAAMNKLFWESAKTDTTGILKKPLVEIGTTYNWDSAVLTAIEAKAFAYLLTGDELYAQQAIYGIKNYILTLVMTTDAQGDLFYAYGSVMRVAAEVYDWCYPVLTELDREQIIAGVENHHAAKMTISCPPIGMNGIQGHGTSSQLAVDYLAFSIAIYDERPDWYNLVGARLYNEWYPFINYYYQTEYFNQGTATYADNKTAYQCRSAWLMKVISGEDPIPGLDKVIYGLLANTLPNGNLFPSGDGTSGTNGVTFGAFTLERTIVVLQALYPNPDVQLLAKTFLNDYTRTWMTFSGYPYTVTNVIIWRSAGSVTTSPKEELYDPIGTVSYAPSPYSQIIARTAWNDENAPTVYMKVGETNLGNHDHEDSGTFQIYYKGLLSSNTGYYGSSGNNYAAPYGSTHHRYYHQATVSSNGFLVYNPAYSGDDPSKPASYYYCGGQIETVGRDTFEDFLNEPTAFKATTTAYDWKYGNDGETPEYAYIAGDLSAAYDAKTVDMYERRMLAIFTDDPDYPMLFFVLDNVTSKDPSFKKTFLLHTTYEPTVNGNVVSTTAGDGKLVLTSLYDGATIEAIGGEGKYFLVNGRPCAETEKTSNHWGRVEISASGEANTVMLNAMYVTDKDNDKHLETKIVHDDDKLIATVTGNTVVALTKSMDRCSDELSFTTEGNGLYRYYVSGLSAGSWCAEVDGTAVANLYCYDEKGFVSFIAPAGTAELIPGTDVKPSNSGLIRYNLGGAALPEDAQEFYVYDEPYTLPTPIHPNNTYVFAGWFTDTTYTEKITEIPVGTRGQVKVYAMFYTNYREDYEKNVVDVSMANKTVGDMNYVLKSKSGSSAKTVTENGNTYLLWHKGTADPRIGITKPLNAFLLDRTFMTVSFDVALDGNNAPIKSYVRLRGELSSFSASIFGIDESGTVLLGNDARYPVTKLTNEFKTLVFTVDLEKEWLYAYDESGKTVAEMPIAKSAAITTSLLEWARNNTYHVFDWYSINTGLDAALKIDNIIVTGEYYKDALSPPGTLAINYNNMENGKLPADAPNCFIAGMGIPELPTPTSDVFNFLGWFTDPELTQPIASIGADVATSVELYAKWELSSDIPSDKAVIIYNALGGKYDLASSVINVGEALKLGAPKLDGYVFGGWYRSESFIPSERIGDTFTATEGGVTTLYAEYYSVLSEDYETNKVDVNAATSDIGIIKYVGKGKADSSFVTVTDKNANTYLTWSIGQNDPQLDKRGVLSTFLNGATAITFELDLAKLSDAPAPTSTFRLRGKSSAYGAHVFTTSADGKVLLGGISEKEILQLTDSFSKIRITVDFKRETIYAFDGDENVIAETPLSIFSPEPITADEFVSSCESFIFDWYSYASSDDKSVILVDNITICTGYVRDAENKEYVINYEGIDGALLPDGTPKRYTEGEGLSALPVPVKDGYRFDGWFSNIACTEPVLSISALAKGEKTLFAKWTLPVDIKDGKTTVIFEVFGGEYAYKTLEIATGEPTSLEAPLLSGYDFLGWYTDPAFKASAYVGDVFTSSEDSVVTLYARFEKSLVENFGDKTLNVSGTDYTDEDGFKYGGAKANSAFRTESDEEGNTYLVWEKGTADSAFSLRSSLADYVGDATKITFTVDLALFGDAPATRSSLRLRGTSSSNTVVLFWIDYSGNVTLGDSGKAITTLTSEFTTVSITVDIKNATIAAKNENGDVIVESDFMTPRPIQVFRNILPLVPIIYSNSMLGPRITRIRSLR